MEKHACYDRGLRLSIREKILKELHRMPTSALSNLMDIACIAVAKGHSQRVLVNHSQPLLMMNAKANTQKPRTIMLGDIQMSQVLAFFLLLNKVLHFICMPCIALK